MGYSDMPHLEIVQDMPYEYLPDMPYEYLSELPNVSFNLDSKTNKYFNFIYKNFIEKKYKYLFDYPKLLV